MLCDKLRRSAKMAQMELVGLPLSDMFRYTGCQKFGFGAQKPYVNRKVQKVIRADWGLLASCHWLIIGLNGFELTSKHFEPYPERRDDQAFSFHDSLDANPPVATSVEVYSNGGLSITMTGGYHLTIDPLPYDTENVENWRFMPPCDDRRGHLVLEGEDLVWSRI